jgi:predicted DNA-binding antitoxin AbrB/MazE fold protein
MVIVVEAIYENGVLRPAEPLPLGEQERVRVTVESQRSPTLQGYGIIGWKGTHEELEQILAEAEEIEVLP